MINISKNTALLRWDSLPENIRIALFDEANVDVLDKIAEKEHISEEKILIVSKLAGYVLMGFLHEEDLEKELSEQAHIPIQVSTSIAETLKKEIFSSFKEDIEKIYSPVSKNSLFIETENKVAPFAPRIDSGFPGAKIPSPSVKPETKPEMKSGGAPAPFILHKESGGVKPISSDFKLQISLEDKGISKTTPEPPKPARVELGIPKPPEEKKPAPPSDFSEPKKPQVIHYTEPKPAPSPFGEVKSEREKVKNDGPVFKSPISSSNSIPPIPKPTTSSPNPTQPKTEPIKNNSLAPEPKKLQPPSPKTSLMQPEKIKD